ncbi:MAG: phosphoribosylanthranilate isomerase [Ilumatobacteraceae bacterium]|jgi:phosphoribosylanthranilate isomerase|nr:phosphoribosylanthranilate isomerase [Ilumatobacteraceae bacterium]
MFIKICGITNEDDALLAVALGADAVGFVFAPSPRQMAAQKVFDITRRLPPEILTVGVFRDEHPSRVVEIVQRSGVKAAQLHGHESPEDVAIVAKNVHWVIKAVTAGSVDARRADLFAADMIMVDAVAPGAGQIFDWNLLSEMPLVNKLILAGGLTAQNVAAGIQSAQPWGVDVSTGVEVSPGKKDALLMKRFIDAVRAAPQTVERTHLQEGDNGPYDWSDENR